MSVDPKVRRVLLVDDDPQNIELLTEMLSAAGHSVSHAMDPETALHRLRAWNPHLVFLDVRLGSKDGLELIPKIRALTQDDYTAVVVVSADGALEDVIRGVEAGADDYLTKPFRVQEVEGRVRVMLRNKELHDQLRRSLRRVEELSHQDDLTGLMNSAMIFRKGEEEVQRTRRFRKPISALLINLDGFSRVNSEQDFAFGSQVLAEAGRRIRSCVRSVDLAARIGSDEYLALLPETDLAGAEFVAERIRTALSGKPFQGERGSVRLTASIGIGHFSPQRQDGGVQELFRSSWEAMRLAKTSGGNRSELDAFS